MYSRKKIRPSYYISLQGNHENICLISDPSAKCDLPEETLLRFVTRPIGKSICGMYMLSCQKLKTHSRKRILKLLFYITFAKLMFYIKFQEANTFSTILNIDISYTPTGSYQNISVQEQFRSNVHQDYLNPFIQPATKLQNYGCQKKI